MMRCRRIFFRRVTLPADTVGRRSQPGAVRFVAIAAGHARREHPALLERAVIVDLVAYLPVGMVEPARQRRDDMRFGQRPAGNPILGEPAAARVAQAAGLDLLAQRGGRDAALPVAGARIDRPGDVAPLVESHRQPFGRIFLYAERTPAPLVARPGDVTRPLAMAGLAADADLRKGSGELV